MDDIVIKNTDSVLTEKPGAIPKNALKQLDDIKADITESAPYVVKIASKSYDLYKDAQDTYLNITEKVDNIKETILAGKEKAKGVIETAKSITAQDVVNTLQAVGDFVKGLSIEDAQQFYQNSKDYVQTYTIPNAKAHLSWIQQQYENNKESIADTANQKIDYNVNITKEKVDSTLTQIDDVITWIKENPEIITSTIQSRIDNILADPVEEELDFNEQYEEPQSALPDFPENPTESPLGEDDAWISGDPSISFDTYSTSFSTPEYSDDLGYMTIDTPSISVNEDGADINTGSVDNQFNMDLIHHTLDVIALAPGIGQYASAANGMIYTLEGDPVNAALSFASMVPGIGQSLSSSDEAIKALQYADDAIKVSTAANLSSVAISSYQSQLEEEAVMKLIV